MRGPGVESVTAVGRRRPLVAVTTSEIHDPRGRAATAEADPPRRELALGLRYVEAIEASGGVPVVLPPMGLDALEVLLDGIDGIWLSGGPDIDPSAYGQEAHPDLGVTERELDGFELALARAADRRRLPILAICRGAQLVNVARGGTLIQHLPDAVGGEIDHRQKERAEIPTHAVHVDERSRLAEILGWRHGSVNSFHHQAVAQLGAGLVATAWSPDGVVEAFEARDRPFLVGVQWHVECLVGLPEHAVLLQAFVAACGGTPEAAGVTAGAASA